MADIQYSVEASGYRSVLVTHIDPQLAKLMLDPLKLGTVSVLSGSNTLLLTGETEQMRKAAVILEVIDTTERYEIRELRSATSPRALPSNDQIAETLGSIVIGTFNRPPRYTNKAKAIIDVQNGSIWAIAPAQRMADIAAALDVGAPALNQQQIATGRITDGTMLDPLQRDAMLEARFNSSSGEKKPNPVFDMDGRPRIAKAIPMASPALLPIAMADAAQAAPGASSDSNGPAERRDTRNLERAAEPNVQPVSTGAESTPPTAPVAAAPNRAAPAPRGSRLTEPPMTASDLSDPERVLDLTLPEKLPIIQLVDLVAKYLNLTCLYDPQDVAGDVSLKLNGDLRGNLKVKDLYSLLESVLKVKNLVMTRHEGKSIVTIVKKDNVQDIDPPIWGVDEVTGLPGDTVVMRVFKLQHIDTASAKNLLEGMRVSLDVKPLEETSTIIVTSYAYRMERIEQLLKIVDRPGEPRKFQYRLLKYTTAKPLAEKVKALAEQLQPGVVTIGVPDLEPINLARNPGETDAAYQARVRQQQILIQQRQQAAAAAAQGRAAQPRPEQSKGVYLDADERTNRILMIGAAKQLDMVNSIVDTLDVEQLSLRDFKLYVMKHVDAQDVAKKLQELGVISRTPETPTAQRITTPAAGARTPTAAAADEARMRAMAEQARIAAGLPSSTEASAQGPVEEPQVVVVESTNSLLVNGTPEQHLIIEKIIGYVDKDIVEEDMPYRIYQLESSSPDHLATILQSLVQETTQNKDKDGKIVETTTVKKIQDEITIVPDPNTYSLIVYANKKNQDWISTMITRLDKRRPQVLIDVTLVEITNDEGFKYDLNVAQSIPDFASTSGLLGGFVANNGIAATSATSGQIADSLSKSGKSQFAETQINGGKFQGFYADKHVQFLMTAIQTKNYGRVLAGPKILVNDNETGKIKTADVTYVEKSSSIPVSTGGAGNQGQLVTTATDYQQYEAGIELNIVPHISEGDLLQLKAVLTRSDFLPTADAKKPPNKTESQVDTSVTVPDGSTIILGGMLKLNQTKGSSKVPLLGDLPLVGGLFRSINNTNDESKLYVFVKAQIIRPATLAKGMDDLKDISKRNREAFEAHEKEFQDYQSWPGVKPTPIEPAKVLDAQ